MAWLRRSFLFLKNQHVHYSTENSGSSFWEIVPKKWRKSRYPEPPADSFSMKLAPSKRTTRFLNKLEPSEVPRWKHSSSNPVAESQALQEILKDESFNRGNSIAVAQYIMFIGGAVQFSGIGEWMATASKNANRLPRNTEMGNNFIGIDISDTNCDFAFISPLKNLHTISVFKAKMCANFDDYCLDHITGVMRQLEELDLSDCPLITSRGLGTLYRLKHLRKLTLDGVKYSDELQLLCILLEEHFKNLVIEGEFFRSDKPKFFG